MLNTLLVALALLIAAILLSKKVRDNRAWRATVTPLASIIGSGFLVIVPLLGSTLGGYAPVAMAGVVAFAYLLGEAIRFNIWHLEPMAQHGASARLLAHLDQVSSIALSFSYFISVAFYLRLLAAFALHDFYADSELLQRLITSAIFVAIARIGWTRGLSSLERLEEYSVSIKLSIIAALIVAWATYDVSHFDSLQIRKALPSDLDAWQVVRLLAGALIVVQGFETSRYLAAAYSAEMRVATMRRAQIIAGLIYVLFVFLTVPTLRYLGDQVDDTAIVDLSKIVATVLPTLLVVAALMSQFSAAVADTIGAGGLFEQTIGRRFDLRARTGYGIVAVVGITLVWTTSIFEIISLASRSFAIYYGLQCTIAAIVATKRSPGLPRLMLVAGFGILASLAFVCAVIAIPAD